MPHEEPKAFPSQQEISDGNSTNSDNLLLRLLLLLLRLLLLLLLLLSIPFLKNRINTTSTNNNLGLVLINYVLPSDFLELTAHPAPRLILDSKRAISNNLF